MNLTWSLFSPAMGWAGSEAGERHGGVVMGAVSRRSTLCLSGLSKVFLDS